MQIRWILCAAFALIGVDTAIASGGGSMPSGGSSFEAPPTESPQQLAKAAHNAGVRYIEKADKLDAEANALEAGPKKDKALKKARGTYEDAAKQFERAVKNDPTLYQSWNYLGYSRRHLGSYDASLEAYERALAINPNYVEAIEYRAEAYLGLNRTDDAKDSYMQLFRASRPLAGQLMVSMQHWVDARRVDAGGLAPEQLDAFAKWVDERSRIASETAAVQFDSGTAVRWQQLH